MQSISISLFAFPNTIALLWDDSSTEQYQVRSSTRSARGAQRRGRKIRPVRPKQSPCSADVRTERAGDTPSLIQHSTAALPPQCLWALPFVPDGLWLRRCVQQLPRRLWPTALEGVTRLSISERCLWSLLRFAVARPIMLPLVSCSHLLGSSLLLVWSPVFCWAIASRYSLAIVRGTKLFFDDWSSVSSFAPALPPAPCLLRPVPIPHPSFESGWGFQKTSLAYVKRPVG